MSIRIYDTNLSWWFGFEVWGVVVSVHWWYDKGMRKRHWMPLELSFVRRNEKAMTTVSDMQKLACWKNMALGLNDETLTRGLVLHSIQGLCYNALRTDGAHHKQWFLEEILKLVSTPQEFERVRDEWKPGIEP